jgi:ribosome-binding protein aMBF1 (putative translation factor)
MADMKYQPVSYDPNKSLDNDLQNPDFKEAYKAIEDEFAALDALLAARRRAGMTQEQVAAKMGVSQPSLARVEASVRTSIPRHWRCFVNMPLL